MQKEKLQKLEGENKEVPPKEDKPSDAESAQEGGGMEPDDADEKAAVVLQSNYRGYRERKKFKERREQNKTLTADELAVSSSSPGEDEDSKAAEELLVEEEDGEEAKTMAGEDEVNPEQEAKAATVLQSNFRGHKERKRLQEEGKLPVREKKAKTMQSEETEAYPVVEDPVETGDEGEEEETRAAVVLQSNFRGHKERKRLQDEGKIPKKQKKGEEMVEPSPVGPDTSAGTLEEPEEEQTLEQSSTDQAEQDEEKAATVLQSNFRGHRERKRLREQREGEKGAPDFPAEELNEENTIMKEEALDVTDIQLEREKEGKNDEEQYDEEQAAVKIQSNFRGYKDRKNLKATAQREEEEVERFSKKVIFENCFDLCVKNIRPQCIPWAQFHMQNQAISRNGGSLGQNLEWTPEKLIWHQSGTGSCPTRAGLNRTT